MSKVLKQPDRPAMLQKLAGASYMTQMLLELAAQAHQRDVELAYFIEMAATVSHELDRKEEIAGCEVKIAI